MSKIIYNVGPNHTKELRIIPNEKKTGVLIEIIDEEDGNLTQNWIIISPEEWRNLHE